MFFWSVASPLPGVQPKEENELIRPTADGNLSVLRAAKASGTVKRVVMTSSDAAISQGVAYKNGKIFTEADWSDPEGNSAYITPYAKSNTLAERAAWDFIEREGEIWSSLLLIPQASLDRRYYYHVNQQPSALSSRCCRESYSPSQTSAGAWLMYGTSLLYTCLPPQNQKRRCSDIHVLQEQASRLLSRR